MNIQNWGKIIPVDDPATFVPPRIHEQVILCPICKGLRGEYDRSGFFGYGWCDCGKCNGAGLLRLRVKYDDIPIVEQHDE